VKPHVPEKLPKGKRDKAPRVAYVVCRRCGLVYLRNAVTARAIKHACTGTEDPQDPAC
jgi:hypothetical protein